MKKESRSEHIPVVAPDGEAAKILERLTPLEERGNKNPSNGGAIVIGTGDLKLPQDFTQGEKDKGGLLKDRVALAILIFSLVFIAFIAWQISTMPSPD